jgi:hypothetical protein
VARLIAPQAQGSTVDLRGPKGSTFTATAPDGLEVRIPAPNGKVTLWLPQPGEWAYAWQDGTGGTITVLPATTIQHKVTGPRRWN